MVDKMPSQKDEYLGVQKQVYYGIKNGRIVTLYFHKYRKAAGTLKGRIVGYWRTSKNPQGGTTFHGKFYRSRAEASKALKKSRSRSRKRSRSKR